MRKDKYVGVKISELMKQFGTTRPTVVCALRGITDSVLADNIRHEAQKRTDDYLRRLGYTKKSKS
jgi:hypothetical protein